MANPEQLEILKQGVDVWNKWRSENPDLIIDFEGANLDGVNLAGANLEGANLERADLRRTDLRRALLMDANLAGANLAGAKLEEAILAGADLRRAYLMEAYLNKANLAGANLERAILVEANLERAILVKANLERADLRRAFLIEANLVGANLAGANLEGTILDKTDQASFATWKQAEQARIEQVNIAAGNINIWKHDTTLDDKHLGRWAVEQEKMEQLKRIVAEQFRQLQEKAAQEAQLAEEKRKQKTLAIKEFKISVAHPKLLSKRCSFVFLVQIYLSGVRQKALQRLKTQFKNQETEEHIENSKLEIEQEVRLHFSSPDITFSDDVIKKLDHEINVTNFMAKPNDNCEPGEHQVILSISDRETGLEYESFVFNVMVKDFAFDHVSRPLLSKISSVALGAGSLAMFILTLVGQIDTTFGLTSGAVGVAVASAIQLQLYRLYQQPVSVHTR